MPWLTALRTRCSTGSIIRSIRNLSISVLWPCSSSAHALAGLARQIADDERHAAEDLADRHQPDAHDAFAQRRAAGDRSRSRSPGSARHSPAGTCASTRASVSASRARLMTRSPTLRISSSRRARSTRTKCDGAAGLRRRGRAGAPARPRWRRRVGERRGCPRSARRRCRRRATRRQCRVVERGGEHELERDRRRRR